MLKQCGECTLCCTLKELAEFPAGERCEHCTLSGCSMYANRPTECSQFNCDWLKNDDSEDLRPDKIGIVFEKLNNELVLGTAETLSLNLLVLKQIIQYNEQGYSVIVQSPNKPAIFPRKGKGKKAIWKKYSYLV